MQFIVISIFFHPIPDLLPKRNPFQYIQNLVNQSVLHDYNPTALPRLLCGMLFHG